MGKTGDAQKAARKERPLMCVELGCALMLPSAAMWLQVSPQVSHMTRVAGVKVGLHWVWA